MKKIGFFLLIMFFISPFCMAKNQEVLFEPANVELTGVITMLKFAGPPNYESIKNGDKYETGPYLILDKPIDIILAPNQKDEVDTPTKNVQIIQLIVFNDKDWKDVKQGNVVRVSGTLSSSITGHHHVRALLGIKQIRVLSKKKIDNKQLHVTDEDQVFLKDQN